MGHLDPEPGASPRDPGRGRIFLAVAAVAAFLLIVGILDSRNAGKPAGLGEEAPDVTLTMMDGSTVRLSDLRGQVVILDFWATWCPPCVESLPALDRFVREHDDDGLVALAVNRDGGDAGDVVRRFLGKHGLGSLQVALDSSNEVARAFRVEVLPTMFVVDREGRIAAAHVGGSGRATLRSLVEPLLAPP